MRCIYVAVGIFFQFPLHIILNGKISLKIKKKMIYIFCFRRVVQKVVGTQLFIISEGSTHGLHSRLVS